MPHLNTARGAIDTTDLGVTLMHEHVFVLTAEVQQNYPEEWGDEDDRVADAVRRLRELYPGINCKIFYQRDYLSLVSKYGLEDVSG